MSDFTIRDIARIAGVSTTAVSFVLNGKPGVSDATRERVQDIIQRTGFTPNAHTRRLNLGRSFTIHVVLYWHSSDLFNQFALEIMYGIFHSCKELGYGVMVTFVDKTMDCTALMESIRSKDCDGVILSQIEDPIFMARLQQENIPFVCVDSHVKKDGVISLVEINYYDAAYRAVKYLCQCGHTQIGFLGPSTPLELHSACFGGYTAALRETGLVCDPAWIGSFDFAAGAAGAYFEKLMQTAVLPTAFFCVGNVFAIEFMRTAQRRGYRIPEDFSIISIDDILVSRFVSPPLTTMTFDKESLGSCAVEMLYAMISGKEYDPVMLLPARLCERGSVRRIGTDGKKSGEANV